MNTVVIYQSKYGFTEIYARWIAEDLAADLLIADQVKASELHSIIVYGGGLYAGSVSGISMLTRNFEQIKDKDVFLFTVGASDVTDRENIDAIRSALSRALTPSMLQAFKIYHLRGGMKCSKLSLMHRAMMGTMPQLVPAVLPSESRNI